MSSDTWHLQRIEVGAAVYTLTPDPRALRRGHGASASALWRQRRQHQTRTWRNRWVMRLWCVLWRVWLVTWCERWFYWALFCRALKVERFSFCFSFFFMLFNGQMICRWVTQITAPLKLSQKADPIFSGAYNNTLLSAQAEWVLYYLDTTIL